MRKTFLTLLFLGFTCLAYTSEPPRLGVGDFEGMEILREQIYSSSELWGLINGGADLYFEYGFDLLLLQELKLQNEFFRLEIYAMDDPVSAFGIYSVSVHHCRESGRIVRNDCLNPFQYQMSFGRYYVSVINETGSEKAMIQSLEIGKKLVGSSGTNTQEGMFHKRGNPLSGRVVSTRIYKGILGIQNGIPGWEKFFEGFSDFTMMVIDLKDEDGILTIAGIEFRDEKDADILIRRIGNSGIKHIHEESGREVLLIDSSDYRGDAEKLLRQLQAGAND